VTLEGTDAGGGASKERGMSTGTKLFFGCLGLALVGVLGLAVAVGGVALRGGFESVIGSVEEHREASETLQRIEREHPFDSPADGVVREAQLERYLAVSRDAWREMEPWVKNLQELEAAARSDRGTMDRLKEMATGAKAMGGLARSRLALASALDDHGVSLGEFAWTGLTLLRASEARARGGGASSGVPAANLELVAAHAGEIPTPDADDATGTVLVLATLWGMNELPTWSGLGLDTLGGRW